MTKVPRLLTNRPLRATGADQQLFVDRAVERSRLERALDLDFNVLLHGAPGAGATSLLESLLVTRSTALRVNAEACLTPAEVVLEILRNVGEPPVGRPPNVREALSIVTATAAGRDRDFLVDGLRADVAYELFGRARDDLWNLRVNWVLAVGDNDLPTVTSPPAGSFFDTRVTIGPMTPDDLVELLERRDADELLDDEQMHRIAVLAAGNPTDALRLARAVVLDGERALQPLNAELLRRIDAELGSSAAALAAELSAHGPASPSDLALQQRMGLSKGHLATMLREMTRSGFVIAGRDASAGQPGRPATRYALKDTIR